MRTKRILLAQCQDANSEAIKRRLEEATEYVVDLVDSGYGVLASVCADVPEALLLDTSLLPLPGSNLCRQMRIPAIVIAQSSHRDR